MSVVGIKVKMTEEELSESSKDPRGRKKGQIRRDLEDLQLGENLFYPLYPDGEKTYIKTKRDFMRFVSSTRKAASLEISLSSEEVELDGEPYIRIWRRS